MQQVAFQQTHGNGCADGAEDANPGGVGDSLLLAPLLLLCLPLCIVAAGLLRRVMDGARRIDYYGYGKRTVPSRSKPSNLRATKQDEATFSEVVLMIAASRERAFQAVNTELIDLYWQVGATISRKIKAAEWGDGVVD
jgi:hypothetical protein